MKIAKYIALFIILIIGGDILISVCMEKVYKETFTGQTGGKVNYLEKHYNHVNILAVGNSRCAHHIVPSQLGKNVYNLSHNGMSLSFQVGLIDELIRHSDTKIDTILLHIELHEIFAPEDEANNDIQHLKYYYDKNDWIKREIDQISLFENTKYWLSSYKWNGRVMSVLNNWRKSKKDQIPTDGYVEVPPSERDSINVMLDLEKHLSAQQGALNKTVNKRFESLLNHAISICKKHEVEIICFTSPIFDPEIETINKANDASLFFKDREIAYYNYVMAYNQILPLKNIHLWRDVHHMNSEGAKLFTNILRGHLYGN